MISCREKEKCRLAYKAILSLHPHLPGLVKACTNFPDIFSNLIHMVSLYMHIYAGIY